MPNLPAPFIERNRLISVALHNGTVLRHFAGEIAPIPRDARILFFLTEPRRFFGNLLGLRNKLLPRFFTHTFRTSCRSVFRRTKRLDSILREITFTCFRRRFATLRSPLLGSPVFKTLLGRLQGLRPLKLLPIRKCKGRLQKLNNC